MKNLLLLILLILLTGAAAQAQKVTVTGRVVGASGEGLPGSTVLERGTSNGTSTGANGEFSLSVNPGATITVQAIGFATQQIPLNGRSRLDVRLAATAQDLNEVVVTGSRATEGRSNILTTAPVDVISAREIKAFAQTDVAQVLAYAAPSFQSTRQTISDGTDHIDPASLRGLGPDQVLVLVNGKRFHNSALVNINGTVGRGAVGTDLNVIPTASLKRIEVLRDGAAALYGSDAIAGVINLQLKDDTTGVTASSTVGHTTKSDGGVFQVDTNIGIGLGGRGYLDLSGQYQNHSYFNRGLPDTAPLIYLGANSGQYPSSATTEQARRDLKAQDDALVAKNGYDRNNLRIGSADTRNVGGFLNAGYRLGGGIEAYAMAGYTHRTGKSAGFARLPNQPTQSDLTIFPNGFLPFINTKINDVSTIVGLRKTIGGFGFDLSNTYGSNEVRYDISNSVNASLPQGAGIRNQTEFYAGTLKFTQNTSNLTLTRKFADLGPLATLNVAVGGEFRVDNFKISAGEPNSYINGGRLIGTAPTASGSQVFPGYQPTDEVNKSRNNLAGFLDLESDLTEKLLVHAAGRVERYSDFGSSASGQLAARFSIIDGLALRGSLGNGFRAPSLQQRYFTNVSTQFISGVPNQILTVNNENPIVRNSYTVGGTGQQGFGVAPLKQENSRNYSLGLTGRVAQVVTLTVDAYQIDIDDRIVLSSAFTRTNTIVNTILGTQPVSRVQFFANAVNTRTQGIDIVANSRLPLGDKSRLGLTAAANFNETTVRSFNSTSTTINNDATVGTSNLQNTLFDRQQRARLENGNPRSKILLSANYTYGIFGLEARSVRFGEVQTKDADPARSFLDQTYAAKWITDLTLNVQVIKQVGVAVGINNLFDVYPDRIIQNPRNDPNNFSVDPAQSYNSSLDNTNRGRFVYNASQFGFQGAFYFGRVNVAF
ncbi:TonB-dependent receptor domain-containing protein [Hymenobacter artigasi]|uniref:Iron complex outermembrane receptor protein n=1 Tax=Hymenobacter artigasi TaxID=2719616 RepID=A0ABX1HDJ3_9BACT|nr:TonB-dependent receptor [Hymenobacter artigasi]NKI88318.1 iron complex outermembrane receptor protein [Hymenobacter artigasi]